MTEHLSKSCTAFAGHRLLSSGSLIDVAIAVKAALEKGAPGAVLVFNDATGRVVDLDLRGAEADVLARLSPPPSTQGGSGEPVTERRGRGRPKLGVVAREVTLLPRHWEWLAAQPGGASVALRKLVDEARRTGGSRHQTRAAQEAAYHFMSTMAGDLPGFEEATRALFAGDREKFDHQVAGWPEDLRAYATRLAFDRQVDGFVIKE